jgi:hypothetical protein
LSPEFQGAVLTGSGVGTMTSDFCSDALNFNDGGGANACDTGEQHNYYSWTANASNTYSIFMKWRAPSDFSEFDTTPAEFYAWSTSTNHTVTLTFYEGGTNCGSQTVSTTGGWTLSSALSLAGCSIAANDELTIRADMSMGTGATINTSFVRMGEIYINYLSRF